MSPHTVVLTAALAALLCLPCAVFAMMRSSASASANGPAMRRAWVRRTRAEAPRLRRLELAPAPHDLRIADVPTCRCGAPPLSADASPRAASPLSADASSAAAAAPPLSADASPPAFAPPLSADDMPPSSNGAVPPSSIGAEALAAGDLPAFEQVLAELRRLHQQRLSGLAQQSECWARAVVVAYDRWLQVACHYLAVADHLSCLTGIDRDIERLRVEAELTAAGLPPIRNAAEGDR